MANVIHDLREAGGAGGASTSAIAELVIDRLHSSTDVCVMAQQALDVAYDVIPRCTAGDVSVVAARGVTAVARVGAGAGDIESLLCECGEGPVITAVASGAPVEAPDLAHDERWPNFGPRVAMRGFISALSIPVRLGRETCALTIYSSAVGRFGEDDELHALLIASLLAAAAPFATELASLSRALRNRDVIGQAKGILMERLRLSESDAFDVLVDLSSRSGRKLAVVAERLAATGEIDVRAVERR